MMSNDRSLWDQCVRYLIQTRHERTCMHTHNCTCIFEYICIHTYIHTGMHTTVQFYIPVHDMIQLYTIHTPAQFTIHDYKK